MISIQSVSVHLNEHKILEDLNVDLSERRIGIIGLNGSGKSTFVRLLNGLQVPSTGGVTVDNLDTKADGGRVRRKVGFVFQNPENQIVYPVVKEDLSFGLKNLKFSKSEINEKVIAALEQYNLTHLAESFTHRLSGGEKQLIALIGVLIMQPEYVVLDEPTTLLDLKNKRHLMSVIHEMAQPVFLVTHDLNLLTDFDRVLCFHEGKLLFDDVPSNVIPEYIAMCEK